MRILCSGYLVRYPLGGQTWHHLQYLVGFRRLGHDVIFLEHFGWENSCYDPSRDEMTSDPAFGIKYLEQVLRRHGLGGCWCYLAEDGTAYGMSREQLAQTCRDCDVYFSLSNMNWIPELEACRRRALVDTDPVFTQIGSHGLTPLARYHARFTFGENVHGRGCEMPTGGAQWLPTRQPVVLDLWPVTPGNPSAPFTTVMNWSAYGEHEYEGRIYGQKDREFLPFFDLPKQTGQPMEIAVAGLPPAPATRLKQGGWRLADSRSVTRTPGTYQEYLQSSRAEFSVAKHAYVSARCGWFSERSACYMASGRPVIVQDTGFSDFLPCDLGLIAYRTSAEAIAAVKRLDQDYERQCRGARGLIEEYFDSSRVLTQLLERAV
jgi:hypothetical protein